MWSDNWVGLPYSKLGRGPEEYDCLGLFLALQKKRFDRDLHDPFCTVSEAVRGCVVETEKDDWARVTLPREGDAALFNVRGLTLHIGYVLSDQHMLHISQQTGCSVIANFNSMEWQPKLDGVYRYARG